MLRRRYYQSAYTGLISFRRSDAVFWHRRGDPVDIIDAFSGVVLRRWAPSREREVIL